MGRELNRGLLTAEERRAVACLERLAKRWPQTLRMVLCHGTREVRVALRDEVSTADDLAPVPGVHIRGLKVDSHS